MNSDKLITKHNDNRSFEFKHNSLTLLYGHVHSIPTHFHVSLINTLLVCLLIYSCPDGCTFEDGVCGYSLTDPTSSVSWMRGSGYSTQRTMAPAADKQGSSTGYFAYVSGQNGQVMSGFSNMAGPTFSRSATNCRVEVRFLCCAVMVT